MRLQTLFNKNWEWFVVNGHKRSVDPDTGSCAYYNLEGERCAIGCALPKKIAVINPQASIINLVSTDIEEWREFSQYVLREFSGIMKEAQELQDIHDRSPGYKSFSPLWPEYIKDRLIKFAKKHNLKVPNANS